MTDQEFGELKSFEDHLAELKSSAKHTALVFFY